MKTDLEIAREILDLAEGQWNAANMAMQSSGDPEWRMEQKVKELRRVFHAEGAADCLEHIRAIKDIDEARGQRIVAANRAKKRGAAA